MISFIRGRRMLVAVTLALLIALSVIGLSYFKKVSAVPGLPFGGFVLSSIVCPELPGGVVLTVGPPVGGNFLVLPTTILYPYAQVRPGVWVLGDYFPGGSCISCFAVGGGKGGSVTQCVSLIEVFGTVNFMGTSL